MAIDPDITAICTDLRKRASFLMRFAPTAAMSLPPAEVIKLADILECYAKLVDDQAGILKEAAETIRVIAGISGEKSLMVSQKNHRSFLSRLFHVKPTGEKN